MPATKAVVAVPPRDKPDMDERKRGLIDDGDSAPSRKRLRDENGNVMRMADDKEKDVEDFQKDAIHRQMKEYKRQKKDAEDQLAELRKKSAYHNDHLRIIDAWFAQLLDEVRTLASRTLPTPPPSAISTGEEMYTSALLFEDNESFSTHLKNRSEQIKGAIAHVYGHLPASSPEVEDLRRQLNDLLAKEKVHAVKLREAIDEKDSMLERLETAMGRYMTAERKLDRAKSSQVQKLERQAINGGSADNPSSGSGKAAGAVKNEHAESNGELVNGTTTVEAEAARLEAIAAVEKQKSQVEEIEKENERLTNELSAARTKLASLTDDDYAETSLFKTLKVEHDDVVKRVNDLQATNIQLREEAQKLQAERSSYRTQIDEETRAQTNEAETASARAETDLARIRHHRDQLHSELAIARAALDSNRSSLQQARELDEANKERIEALESRVVRLQVQCGEIDSQELDIDSLDQEALKVKLRALQHQHTLLNSEMPSMEKAWERAQALASKKISDMQAMEDQIARSTAEKAKADQKYFAAMKAKDMRETEVRTLKSQNIRSSEIVSQLKDAEAKTKELCSSYERQLAEANEGLARLEQQYRQAEHKLIIATTSADGLRKNVEELKAQAGAREQEHLATAKAKRDFEEDLERMRARADEAKRQYDTLRKTKAAINNADSDDWRKVAICPVCNANIRNTVLKLCGHVFCSSCIRDLISNRSRKCPSCARAFGNNDSMPIVLT